MKKKLAPFLCALGRAAAGESAGAAELDLYVDRKTKQIFAEPGPGRDRLGTFVQVDAQGKVSASVLPAPA
ncbi:porin, partial [Xanthomonas sp. Kuri4-2]